jgi:hypothetical protein
VSSGGEIRQPGGMVRVGKKRGERGEGGLLIEGIRDAVAARVRARHGRHGRGEIMARG